MKQSTPSIRSLAQRLPRSYRMVAAVVVSAFIIGYVAVPAKAAGVTGLSPEADLDPSPSVMDILVGNRLATARPEEPPTVREILLDVCRERGYGEACARILYGMMWRESRFIARAVGDQGRAHGYFQIHYRLHKISLECARDVRCSAAWSLSYMERNGYPKYVNHAIQCHNGCGANNGYVGLVKRAAAQKWSEADVEEATKKAAALAAAEAEAPVAEAVVAESAEGQPQSAPVESETRPVASAATARVTILRLLASR